MLGTWNRDGQIAAHGDPARGDSNLCLPTPPGSATRRGCRTRAAATSPACRRRSRRRASRTSHSSSSERKRSCRARRTAAPTSTCRERRSSSCDEVAATGKPVVLVVLAGRPLTIPDVFDKARAVLYAWHPGTMTGPALADLLFGVGVAVGQAAGDVPEDRGPDPRLLRAQEHGTAAHGAQAHPARRHPAARAPELARRRCTLPRHRLRAALPVRLRPLVHELPLRQPQAGIRAGEAERDAARARGPHQHRIPRGRRGRPALRAGPGREPDPPREGAERLPARAPRRGRDADRRVRRARRDARLPRPFDALRRRAGGLPPVGRRRLAVRSRGRIEVLEQAAAAGTISSASSSGRLRAGRSSRSASASSARASARSAGASTRSAASGRRSSSARRGRRRPPRRRRADRSCS